MPTIAIIGASLDREKFGNKAVRAYKQLGWRVFPVNPKAAEIEGLKCYPSIADLPAERLDRISLYVPAAAAITLLDTIAHRAVGELWFNPGADSPELLAKASQLGINAIRGCSILDLGIDPHRVSDV